MGKEKVTKQVNKHRDRTGNTTHAVRQDRELKEALYCDNCEAQPQKGEGLNDECPSCQEKGKEGWFTCTTSTQEKIRTLKMGWKDQEASFDEKMNANKKFNKYLKENPVTCRQCEDKVPSYKGLVVKRRCKNCDRPESRSYVTKCPGLPNSNGCGQTLPKPGCDRCPGCDGNLTENKMSY